MTTSATDQSVATTTQRDYSTLALILAIISVPGSWFTWDVLPGGGFVWGLPFSIAAVALGVISLRSGQGKGKSIAAIVIAGAMLLMIVGWTLVASIA